MTTDRGHNPFHDAVVAAVHRAFALQSDDPMAYEAERGAWLTRSRPRTFVRPVSLSGPGLAVDVTDRGVLLLPVAKRGRYALDLRLVADTGPLSPVEVAVLPGAVEIELGNPHTQVMLRVWADAHGLHWAPRGEVAWLRPHLCWTPAEDGPTDPLARLRPLELDVLEPLATSSNSRLPDPFPPTDLPEAWLRLEVDGADLPALPADIEPGPLLAERATPQGTVITPLPGWSREALAQAAVHVACPGRRPEPASGLDVEVPEPAVMRQLRFSVPNSLMSLTTTPEGKWISLHGRRDRGFGDVAHLHQSHQIHLVALACGATGRVREELLAFAALQERDGAIRCAPGAGTRYPYVSGYTEEHLLLGVHRYLRWTGDGAILDEPVPAADGTRPLRDRLLRLATYLLGRSREGLLPPCGWHDAWPPRVLAQAQVSMAGAWALEALADVRRWCGEPAEELTARAAFLRHRVDEVFYDAQTGLYGEHLFEDGVRGGRPEDFWCHTQVWAVLTGQTQDPRGLDLVRSRCFRNGIAGVYEGTLDQPYVAESTDADVDLELNSTATWTLATWPELTHLYALAELKVGRPERALSALLAQLPETLHGSNPFVAPWYYAEKYLYPGDEPWLFTWGGDPTLVQLVLCGFLGVRPTLDQIEVRPNLPAAWSGQPLSAQFQWRGKRHALAVDATGQQFELTETS